MTTYAVRPRKLEETEYEFPWLIYSVRTENVVAEVDAEDTARTIADAYERGTLRSRS